MEKLTEIEKEKVKEMDLKLLYIRKNLKKEVVENMAGFLNIAIDTEKYYQDEIIYHNRRYAFETETDKYKETLQRLEQRLSKAKKRVAELQIKIGEDVNELEEINNAIENIENIENIETKGHSGMILYNCTSEKELELKEIQLEKLTVASLRTLAIDIATDFQNGVLDNEIIVMDAMLQITSELATRCNYELTKEEE